MRILATLLVLTTIPAVGTTASIDKVHLSPTTITIGAPESAASLLIKNEGSNVASFTIAAYAWRMTPANDMVLDRTDDLIVYPLRVDVEPGVSRRVRIGTRVRADRVERAYRLVLEPAMKSAPAAGAIAMQTRYNLPVFVQPKTRTATVTLGDISVMGGEILVSLENRGLVHVTPRALKAAGKDASGNTIWTRDLSAWYVLPGDVRTFRGSLTADECRRTAVIDAEAAFLEGAALTVRRTQAIGRAACALP